MTLAEITGKFGEFEETGIAVTDALVTVATIDCNRADQGCRITVKNSGAVALDQFAVAIRPTTNATFITHASAAAAFTTAIKLPMVDSSGSPVTMAAGASSTFKFDISGIDAIRLQAGGAGGATTMEIYAGFGV